MNRRSFLGSLLAAATLAVTRVLPLARSPLIEALDPATTPPVIVEQFVPSFTISSAASWFAALDGNNSAKHIEEWQRRIDASPGGVGLANPGGKDPVGDVTKKWNEILRLHRLRVRERAAEIRSPIRSKIQLVHEQQP